jgi:hypothetical protein
MENRFVFLISFILFIAGVSCTTVQSINKTPSATTSGSRIIILERDTISAKDVGGFTCWRCKDYSSGGKVLVEVGYFGADSNIGPGFVLYDGGNTGVRAYYNRSGLEHRWDWGTNSTNFSFVIDTDGIGRYYDFSGVPKGELRNASSVYRCKRR